MANEPGTAEVMREARKRIAAARESNSAVLDLSNSHLNEPYLSAIIDDICQLSALTSLYLSSNQLTTLPEEFWRLTALTTLYLGNNRLATLPESMGKLTALRELYLDYNRLTTLPEAVGNLTALITLELRGNQLTTLPEAVVKLTALTSLDLSRNKLRTLPEAMGRLNSLTSLDVANNRLVDLPTSIGHLDKLRRFNVGTNQLPPEIRAIARHTAKAKVAFFRTLLGQGTHQDKGTTDFAAPFHEAKLLFVGPGAAGKTWLLHALQGRVPPASSPSTVGIEIDRQTLPLPHPSVAGATLRFNCWDFGGQEPYQITHQIFFSPRAVYLLVYDPRKGAVPSQVEERLERIRASAGASSRVIIVSTRADDPKCVPDAPESALRERFGFLIHSFHAVDSEKGGDGRGIALLRDAIATVAASLHGMEYPVLAPWRNARNYLLARDEPLVRFADVAKMCANHGLDASDTDSLLTMLHELGHLVYFSDAADEDGTTIDQADNAVVLRPEWIAKAVGLVVHDQRTIQASGILRHNRLDRIWAEDPARDSPGYPPNLHRYFLWLMWRCRIAYEISARNSLVPEMIMKDRPRDLQWEPGKELPAIERELTLIREIEETPPVGLVPALIVAMHPLRREIEEQTRLDTLDRNWTKGAFIETERRGSAFIELRDRRLWLVTRAGYPRTLMDELRSRLDEVLQNRWPNLSGGYVVPCLTRDTNGTMCRGVFSYDRMEGKLHEVDSKVECDKCGVKHVVANLLEGFDVSRAVAQDHAIRIETELQKANRSLAELQSRADEMWAAVSRIHAELLDGEREEVARGPTLYSLLPEDLKSWKFGQKGYRLTFWCDNADQPHPVVPIGSGQAGDHVLEAPAEWLVAAAPYVSWLAFVLKVALPPTAGLIKTMSDSMKVDELKAMVDLMGDFGKALPSGKLDLGDHVDSPTGLRQSPKGAALRVFHDQIEAKLKHRQWGGLVRKPDPRQGFRWLCPVCAERIDPSPPPAQALRA